MKKYILNKDIPNNQKKGDIVYLTDLQLARFIDLGYIKDKNKETKKTKKVDKKD
jgi:hypothetical protein